MKQKMLKTISNFGQDAADGLENRKNTGINTRNLQSAWRATGIIPYNPSAV